MRNVITIFAGLDGAGRHRDNDLAIFRVGDSF